MGRKILAIVLGILVGGGVVAAVEFVSSLIYPMPDGLDPSDMDALGAWIRELPVGALLIVLLAHALGAFSAGFVCGMVTGKHWPRGAMALGLFFLVAGVANIVMLPHPTWFALVDVLLYVPSAIAGSCLAGAIRGAGNGVNA